MAQAEFLRRQEVVESASDFDDVSVAQSIQKTRKKKIKNENITTPTNSSRRQQPSKLHYLSIVKLFRILNAERNTSIFQISLHRIERTILFSTTCSNRIFDRCDRNEFQIATLCHNQFAETQEIDQLQTKRKHFRICWCDHGVWPMEFNSPDNIRADTVHPDKSLSLCRPNICQTMNRNHSPFHWPECEFCR